MGNFRMREDGTFTPRVVSSVSGKTLEAGKHHPKKDTSVKTKQKKAVRESVDSGFLKRVSAVEDTPPDEDVVPIIEQMGTDITDFTEAQQNFFKHLVICGTPTVACLKAGVSRKTFLDWKQIPGFVKYLEDFQETLNDMIESEVYRRATSATGSDQILMFAAKGAKPDKYRDNGNTTQVGIIFQMPTGIMGEADADAPGLKVKG